MSALKEFMYVHFSHLTVSRDSPRREDVGSLSRLKSRLLARGVEEPLGVRKIDDSAFMVVSGRGYRRYLAINELVREGHETKFQKVPVHVLRQGGAIEDALALLSCDVSEPMPATVKAKAIRFLVDSDIPLSQIALMTGMGDGEIREVLSAADARPDHALWRPATEAVITAPTPRQRIDELFAHAAQLPEGQGARVAQILASLGEYVDGRISATEAISHLARANPAPAK